MYLIKNNNNQYLTKNKYPNNYPYDQSKYVWTKSYWQSNLFTQEEAEQLIKEYGGTITDQYKENSQLFKKAAAHILVIMLSGMYQTITYITPVYLCFMYCFNNGCNLHKIGACACNKIY